MKDVDRVASFRSIVPKSLGRFSVNQAASLTLIGLGELTLEDEYMPTLQTLTLSDLKRAVQHALTKPIDALVGSEAETINDALVEFCTQHEWQWTRSPFSPLLGVTANQNFILLPEDFGQLIELTANNNLVCSVTVEEIIRIRAQQQVAGPYGWLAAVSYAGGADTTDLPRARLEIYPTPTATAASVFGGIYRRQIRRIVDDDDVPDVPAFCHPALKKYVRASALYDDHQEHADMEMQRAAALIEQARQFDGANQGNLGMTHGASQEFEQEQPYVPRIVITP